MGRIAICLLILCVAGPVRGQGTKQAIGAGVGISCGAWLEERNSSNQWVQTGQWALGYLSGAATYSTWLRTDDSPDPGLDPLRDLDGQAVFAWLDKHCRENPLISVLTALGNFAIRNYVIGRPR